MWDKRVISYLPLQLTVSESFTGSDIYYKSLSMSQKPQDKPSMSPLGEFLLQDEEPLPISSVTVKLWWWKSPTRKPFETSSFQWQRCPSWVLLLNNMHLFSQSLQDCLLLRGSYRFSFMFKSLLRSALRLEAYMIISPHIIKQADNFHRHDVLYTQFWDSQETGFFVCFFTVFFFCSFKTVEALFTHNL